MSEIRKWGKKCGPLLLVFVFPFFLSCGLDEYYTLRPILEPVNYPTDESQYDRKYFDFYTNDLDNKTDGSFAYLGTAVYYKIYDDGAKAKSDRVSIETRNTSTASNAASYMIESLKYRELAIEKSPHTKSPLIPNASANKRVYIRLTSYQDTERYKAKIIYSYSGDPSASAGDLPRRNSNDKFYTFDFSRHETDDNTELPAKDDEDVSVSGGRTVFFVEAYAVAIGRDETYTRHYSPVTHLGTIRIDSEDSNGN